MVSGSVSAASPLPQVHTWQWQGYSIRYQQAGDRGTPLLCIHGFGASSDHWRKNLPVLAQHHRVYAIDLLGFGFSAKPAPAAAVAYTFETWAAQVIAFCQDIIGEPVFIAGNSIGCVVALQAAAIAPDWVRSIAMLDCSLRLLHDRKRSQLPWYQRASTPLFQQLLGYAPFGRFFFGRIARPQVIGNLLRQAYCRHEAVTDELIEAILAPAQQPGAADVFLAFVRYSQGPLAEDLLPLVTCPVLIIWGAADPWEPVELGRALAEFPVVEDFIVLEGIGHCPQDEAPELVNPILQAWLERAAAQVAG